MTSRGHLIVRGGAVAAALLTPIVVLLPHRPVAAPVRVSGGVDRSVATPALAALPLLFGDLASSPPRDVIEAGRPKLVGVAGTFPGDAIALVRLSDGPTRTVKAGDSVGEWRLSALEPDRATFARGGEHYDSILDSVD